MLSKLLGLFKSGSDKPARTAAGNGAVEMPPGRAPLPSPLPRGAFADAYADYVCRHAPQIKVDRLDDGVHLTWPDGGTMRQFLNNAYANYRRDAARIEDIFDTELAAAREAAASMSKDAGLDLALVLPVVKTDEWLATVRGQRGADDDPNKDLLVQPLVPGLIVVHAQDLPSSLEYVKRGDLTGIDEAALTARARTNLQARLPDITVQGADGRYRITLDGFFDVSLVLVAAQWAPQLTLNGDPVFALPCRDELMVCGSDDHEAVTELAALAPRMAAESSYAITGQLLVWRDGALQVL
jgi:hypothetical protein